MRVIQGTAAERRTTPLEEAYAHFRLDRQGLPVSPATLRMYDYTIGRFLRWVRSEHPDVRRFEDLDVVVVRQYRAELASRPGLRGLPIQPETLSGSDRALRTFFRWASAEGYPVADRILALPKVRVPWKEPTLFHIRQLREILAACNPRLPQEGLAVRLLVGAGVRRLELSGLAVEGPDGLPDLNMDSLDRGIVELRVRGEAGAKGMRARRVPVAVFAGDPQLTVLHGRTEVGALHPLTLAAPEDGPRLVLLGGRSWRVTHVDWSRRRCYVEPAAAPGRSRWHGSPQVLHAPLCQTMRDVVLGAEPPVSLTKRAHAELAGVRSARGVTAQRDGTVAVRDAAGRVRWWTWAGGRANASLAAALGDVVEGSGRTGNLSLRLRDGVSFDDLRAAIRSARGNPVPPPSVTEESVRGLKFNAALPPELADRVISTRLGDAATARTVLDQLGPVSGATG